MYVQNVDLALLYKIKWSDKLEKSCSILECLYQKVEAVDDTCSSKQVFLEILQISKEEPVLESLFNKAVLIKSLYC